MRVATVHLNKIACFDDLLLDFVREDAGEPAPWVILLGENGTGKSTLLQMIGATLLTWPDRAVVAGNVNWESYITNITNPHNILTVSQSNVGLIAEPGDDKYQNQASIRTLSFSLPYGDDRNPLGEPPFSRDLIGGWFMCGYGTMRQISGRTATHRDSIPTRDNSYKP